MDCVTCMLMGMCMLCTSDMSASEPGRPMTRAEVDQAVVRVVHRFRQEAEKDELDRRQRELQESRRDGYERRQSFYDDPRYSYSGIGKRKSQGTFPPIDYPPRISSQIVSHLKDDIPPRFVGRKVLLLYPSHNNRKLTITWPTVPSNMHKNHPKSLHSQGHSTSSTKDATSDMAVKRATNRQRLHRGIGKSSRTYIYRFEPGVSKTSHSSSSWLKLKDLLKRKKFHEKKTFKVTFHHRQTGKDSSEKLIRVLSNKIMHHKRAC